MKTIFKDEITAAHADIKNTVIADLPQVVSDNLKDNEERELNIIVFGVVESASNLRNPAHTPCLFSIDLHTVRQHLVIVHFLLLLLLSGALFQMMSDVPYHCHHLSLV